ncbi:MAG: hypothetical protein F4Z07_06645 [Dehalococcoidia bacterium]|nr:hypothetical protein [Dehalococcoidia bacterium]
MMRVPLLLIALVDVAAACAPEESDFRGQAEGAPIPADGSCRAGVVVPRGERCTHEYSYRVGTRITSSGSQSVVEVGAVVFRVDADGVGHYGDALFGTHIERTIEFDGEAIRFVARARDDGSLDIEEATGGEGLGASADAPVCAVGMTLAPGERCLLPGGGGEFPVEPDGDGCFEGSLCSARSLQVGGFAAERSGDAWTVTSLP